MQFCYCFLAHLLIALINVKKFLVSQKHSFLSHPWSHSWKMINGQQKYLLLSLNITITIFCWSASTSSSSSFIWILTADNVLDGGQNHMLYTTSSCMKRCNCSWIKCLINWIAYNFYILHSCPHCIFAHFTSCNITYWNMRLRASIFSKPKFQMLRILIAIEISTLLIVSRSSPNTNIWDKM